MSSLFPLAFARQSIPNSISKASQLRTCPRPFFQPRSLRRLNHTHDLERRTKNDIHQPTEQNATEGTGVQKGPEQSSQPQNDAYDIHTNVVKDKMKWSPTAYSGFKPQSSHRPPPRPKNPSYEITFTCDPCSHRSKHTVSKQGYHWGSVLITCPECKNRHVISDHLKIFGDTDVTIEDMLREKRQLVKKGSLSVDGNLELWEDGTENARPMAAGLSPTLDMLRKGRRQAQLRESEERRQANAARTADLGEEEGFAQRHVPEETLRQRSS